MLNEQGACSPPECAHPALCAVAVQLAGQYDDKFLLTYVGEEGLQALKQLLLVEEDEDVKSGAGHRASMPWAYVDGSLKPRTLACGLWASPQNLSLKPRTLACVNLSRNHPSLHCSGRSDTSLYQLLMHCPDATTSVITQFVIVFALRLVFPQ